MNIINLEISQDHLYEFFQFYDTLGNVQQKIWKAVSWWCKKFPCAYPKQEKIAQNIGCSRKHVNRTLDLFKKLGWISLISRGNKRTKILSIPHHLIQIDLIKRKFFKKVEVTSEVTHSYSSYARHTSKASHLATHHQKNIEIPEIAIKLNCSRENSLKLGLLSEFILQETLHECKRVGKSGFRPQCEESYFVGIAMNIAKKQNFKVEWPRYYSQVNKF